ncbi:unnamed protein product [marine sediment metagenome]|uniref:Uncharacterized protein n=1 Tax=marine sediment metagenome TaxID=412755 RepID=X1CTG7_9ZZZZ
MNADLELVQPKPYVLVKCRHCGYSLGFLHEAKDNYIYTCQNKECKAWNEWVTIPKEKLAEKLASK